MPPIEMLTNYGLAGAVIAIVAVAIWRVSSWLAVNVARPVVKGHLEFLDTMGKHAAGEQQTSDRIEGRLVILDGRVTRVEDKLDVVIYQTASGFQTQPEKLAPEKVILAQAPAPENPNP